MPGLALPSLERISTLQSPVAVMTRRAGTKSKLVGKATGAEGAGTETPKASRGDRYGVSPSHPTRGSGEAS